MGAESRRVRETAQDAADEPGYDDMVWENDILVPRQPESPLDRETLDEQSAHGMGPNWEPRRE